MKSSNIKGYRKAELTYYVIANVLVMIFIKLYEYKKIAFLKDFNLWENIDKICYASLISFVVYIFIYVLDSAIPSQLKWKICFPFKTKKPSAIIFSRLKEKDDDDRFKYSDVEEICGDILKKLNECPTEEERNRISRIEWFRIFSLYDCETKILISKKDYVISRDLLITTWFLLLGTIIFNATSIYRNWWTCVYVLFELVVLYFAVWAKGMRLCKNVIAFHITKEINKKNGLL
ncbi:hypothetical protein SAMN02910413_0323 [Pseudobutyrivibrio sp. C4]|uniref:hypothetical protein n=1 Tax=Pseudobutyrivibrio sp. C4 TaxID=1520803 RepID=UPI0008B333F4|nr:hypothetical protein [Pseudobutyrivibrio sp. C4]SES65810.1 hypothetical protein SAMN02910413_0323 [Pseudobutyrivibrio sp. C4]